MAACTCKVVDHGKITCPACEAQQDEDKAFEQKLPAISRSGMLRTGNPGRSHVAKPKGRHNGNQS